MPRADHGTRLSSTRMGSTVPSAGARGEHGERGVQTHARPRSVLMLTPRWARDGGVGAHVQRSAELLARAGSRVHVVVARIESDESIDGVTVMQSERLFDREAPVGARLGDALEHGAEVTHVHQVDDPVLVDAVRDRAALVVSAHGYTACTSGVYYFRPGHECSRGHGPGCVPNLLARGCAHMRNPTRLPTYYRAATRGLHALERADLVVSYSSSVDRHLAANSISERMIVPYFPTMAARPGSGHGDRRRVVFAGRITRAKGVRVLVAAARKVDAEFVLCGDGAELASMRRLAQRYGLEQRVRFTGWLAADDLARELAEASVVAIPSVWPEPFGLVGIEGFAAGRPAVASATGGIGDWLDDGVSGLLVRPGDARALARALDVLLGDPERQERMGAAGRRHTLVNFSPERHLRELFRGYARAKELFAARSR
jgi:glycosyltransferase involved in cell wall biosynthesis